MITGFFETLEEKFSPQKKCRVVVPLAQDEACSYAVCRAFKAGTVAPILIGNPVEIRKMYPVEDSSTGLNVIEENDADKACRMAVSLVRKGEADIIMKGLVPTSSLLKAVLNTEEGIKRNPLLSHLCFFETEKIPGMRILTDAAINIAPDAETLCKIVKNAVEAFALFSREVAKVALLSANEKVSEKVSSTVLAKTAAENLKSEKGMIVSGPISLDLAVSPESVKIKKFNGPVQGDADIFVVPRIEVGNVFYKSLQYYAGARMAGVVYGAKCPVVLTSRSDSNDTKYFSLLLGMTIGNCETGKGETFVSEGKQ